MGALHFDPLNAVLILLAIVASYKGWISTQTHLENESKWHTEWIKKHSEECDQRDRNYTAIIIELQKSNSHLTTLTEADGKRLDRIEASIDKKR